MYRNRNNLAAATETVAASSSDDEDDHPQEIDSSSVCRWSKNQRVYECTRCGYVSQRKSNVGRHYKRIHCELKKYKTCVCDQVFKTKGEYYEHCDRLHPHLRHSWFITTEKYKIGTFRPELPLKDDSVREPSNRAVKVGERRAVRCSTRLLSLYGKSVCNDQDVVGNDVPDDCEPKEAINCINNKNDRVGEASTDDESQDESDSRAEPVENGNVDRQLVEDVSLENVLEDDNMENVTAKVGCSFNEPQDESDSSEEPVENGNVDRQLVEDVRPENVLKDDNKENVTARVGCNFNIIQEDTISSTDSTVGDSEVSKFKSASPSVTDLPLKKRFGNFTKRKGLSDITNIVNNMSNEQTLTFKRLKFNCVNFNHNQVQAGDHNSAIVNDAPRAFISQIDFDELDAILNLKYLQNSVH